MRCQACDYPLWNLSGDICPECGTHYKPSDFKFVPGSVKFLCPNCEQQYYGTTTEGHLKPSAFECVQCGEQVEMNSMRLQPADGWEEELTVATTAPWSNPNYGLFRRWISTIGWAHVKPVAFMKGLPLDKKVGSSWLFFIVLQSLCAFISLTPGFLVMILMAIGTSGQANARGLGIGLMVFVGLGWLLGWVFSFAIFALIWALLTHATLKMTGGCAHSFGRTLSAILFSSGTLVMTAVPCLGIYCLSFVSTIWWIVSAAFMVIAAQRVSGLRGSLAAIWPPILLIAATSSLYLFAVFGMVTVPMPAQGNIAALSATSSQQALTTLQQGLRQVKRPGAWPESLLEIDLSPTGNRLALAEVINGGDLMKEVVPGVDGFDFSGQSVAELGFTRGQLYASMIGGDGFERIGGLVYCCPGLEGSGSRWLLVAVSDADPSMQLPMQIVVVFAGGGTTVISESEIPAVLREQDALRAADGLPSISEAILDAIESVTSERLKLEE